MTVKQLRAFLAVAHTLSFAQACERLHLSQSALSLAIKALEEGLGGQLFTRTTRNVQLTPEGEALLPLARRLLADWDNAEDELNQRFTLQRGRVSIAAMPSFAGNLLPQLLTAFRGQFPKVGVTVNDVIQEQVIDMVQARHVEIGIAFEPNGTSLKFEPLYVDRFVAVVSKDSPLASYKVLDWQTLLSQPFISLQRPSTVRFMLEQHLHDAGLDLSVDIESHQLFTVGCMVASGLGVSAVPALCIKQMHELGARCISLGESAIERPVGILTKADHKLSVAAQALHATLLSSTLPSFIEPER